MKRQVPAVLVLATVLFISGCYFIGTRPWTNPFVATGDDQGNVYVIPSRGDGTFGAKILASNIGAAVCSITAADFDNDADLDVVVQGQDGKSWLLVNEPKLVSENPRFSRMLIDDDIALYGYPQESAAADFDKDGHCDYIVLSAGAYLYLFMNNVGYSFSRYTINADWFVNGRGLDFLVGIDIGDFDEDGHMDFVVAEYREYGKDLVYLYLGDGMGGFTHSLLFDKPPDATDIHTVVAGDFDKDGHLDLILGQDDDGEPGQTWLYTGDGTGSFVYAGEAYDTNPSVESGSEYSGQGFADAYDFDGDRNLDIIASAAPYGGGDSGTMYFRGNGNGSFDPFAKVDVFIGKPICGPPTSYR